MNTPYSMALGWGSLLFAGGIAYFYAKRDINDRREREHKARLSHTSGVALQRHHAAERAKAAGAAGGPSTQMSGVTDQSIGGEPAEPPKYRIATGNSSSGRDRGDRL